MPLILLAATTYLLGSFPTAYLFLKRKHNLDIRKQGSGNVGAMNSYEITGSKSLGIIIGGIDFAKGAAAWWIGENIFQLGEVGVGVGIFFVVAGHVFSPWIGWRGGRGLATAAGALAFSAPVILAAWIVSWGIVFLIRRNITTANVVALIAVLVIGTFAPLWWWWPSANSASWSVDLARFLLAPTLILILIAHVRGQMKSTD